MRAILALLFFATAAPLAAQPGQGGAGPALPSVLAPRPAAASSQPEAPVNGVVILYGNQKCPTNAAGEEVVVCARRGASEQFRIPRELRDGTIKPEYESFANQGQRIIDAARTGVGTCDMTGPGGSAGCRLQDYQNWGRQKDDKKAADKKAPLDRYR